MKLHKFFPSITGAMMSYKLLLCLLSLGAAMNSSSQEQPIIGQYNEELINILGYMNGVNFLSQGGTERIDFMVNGINLSNKKILDVGCGVGGPALYLADRYNAFVYGVDVDPFLVRRAQANGQKAKRPDKVSFHLIEPNKLFFGNNYFDVIFSKEAIVHSKNKFHLFIELYRVLKPGGVIIIMDWFKDSNKESQELKLTLEIDKLVMNYVGIKPYCDLLKSVGFKNVEYIETSDLHLKDTKNDYQRLHTEKEQFTEKFGQKTFEESLATWKAHIEILERKEVTTFLIKATK
jgi:phosphoethanolamine N-methyltransferase